ncbi:DUF2917 domain-containing protein [Geobacter sp. SVR]|uniref:DUF2917 domain-containing protein n=1 Tax=Geobacter sp. SVR TaxID=2495594 RepID=UPI00143EFB51|nr:DUF2917 domain-containing protein [Geobacter sp. SVR]BCS52795.1 hypothetical protein GSVR_11030 [Geobacter sp. SVR]GCF86661.1 hypothetical protein GSbR_32610 [Geobacter sp. SVR]
MEYVLGKGEVISVAASAGNQTIQVVAGEIWLTRSGDSRDYILRRANRFSIAPAESVVLEALEEASFTLVPAEATAPARLILHVPPAVLHKA